MLVNQWKDEVVSAFRQSAQIMTNMNKKVHNKYGADFGINSGRDDMLSFEQGNNISSCERVAFRLVTVANDDKVDLVHSKCGIVASSDVVSSNVYQEREREGERRNRGGCM